MNFHVPPQMVQSSRNKDRLNRIRERSRRSTVLIAGHWARWSLNPVPVAFLNAVPYSTVVLAVHTIPFF
jgi:hypothetical protein